MAWVRLHENAISHPKIVRLNDAVFRLWIWGLCYCQNHLTDGRIPSEAIPRLQRRHVPALVQGRLWEHDAIDGRYVVHDYLDWNDRRDVVLQKRAHTKARVDRFRATRNALQNALPLEKKRVTERVTERVSNAYPQGTVPVRTVRTSTDSTDDTRYKRVGNGVTDDATAERAARFLEHFEARYTEKTHGARMFRRQPALDFDRACKLVATWDDAHLDKLLTVFFGADDDWILKTDRGLSVFESRAQWCDEKLRKYEHERRTGGRP